MYLDGGDELYVGSARDNMLAFDSQVAGADGAAKGQVKSLSSSCNTPS